MWEEQTVFFCCLVADDFFCSFSHRTVDTDPS